MFVTFFLVSPSLSDSGLNIKGRRVSDILACLCEVIGAALTHSLEAPPTASGGADHLHLKGQHKTLFFAKPSKSDNFNMLYKHICGVF